MPPARYAGALPELVGGAGGNRPDWPATGPVGSTATVGGPPGLLPGACPTGPGERFGAGRQAARRGSEGPEAREASRGWSTLIHHKRENFLRLL